MNEEVIALFGPKKCILDSEPCCLCRVYALQIDSTVEIGTQQKNCILVSKYTSEGNQDFPHIAIWGLVYGNHYEKPIIRYGSSPVTDTITEMGVAHTSRPVR